jgi:MEMO1 family protein
MISSVAKATADLIRRPAVAGSFYPSSATALESLTDELVREAQRRPGFDPGAEPPAGLLVPHAGLQFSGIVAAAGWVQLIDAAADTTVVLLGTNHGTALLDGVGVWDRGTWLLPSGVVEVDEPLAAAVAAMGAPFRTDTAAHLAEHSIEVQLPLLHSCAPRARIVPLAVATGRGHAARAAGRRLGELLREERNSGRSVVLAISTDMAHYPPAGICMEVTATLTPAIVAGDATTLDARERSICDAGLPGLRCGMCGIEPAIVGLAALRAMGFCAGAVLSHATSADAGGPRDQTVGYLAARFDRPEGDRVRT